MIQGKPPNKSIHPPWTAAVTKRDQVLDWYERGFSAEDIAKEVRLPIIRVREMLREHDPDYDG